MGKHEDQVEQTKNVIKEAMAELLKQKPFDKISLVELSKKSHIHRTTIYNHFESTLQILEAIKDDIYNSYEKKISASDCVHDKLKNCLDMLSENRGFFLQYFMGNANVIFNPQMNEHIKKNFDKMGKSGIQYEKSLFIISGTGSIVKYWLE